MEKKEVKWSKLFILGLGGVIGLSHLGMIGALMNRESKLPSINVPVGPYTSYNAIKQAREDLPDANGSPLSCEYCLKEN